MSNAQENKAGGAKANKAWIWLVAAFALLVIVGIATS